MEYAIGVQSFEEIRRYRSRYADKTEFVWKLATTGKYYFLSRPRRFGKSLLLSTIEAYFLGKKELFEGLAIYDLEKEWKRYPVFHFSFNTVGSRDVDDLTSVLDRQLSEYETKFGVFVNKLARPHIRLAALIQTVSEHNQVVVLVDEYDKPLLNTIDNPQLQDEFREVLKPFFGVLKDMDSCIRFAMITGVARFGKVSIFSDLNNLRDISLDTEYNAVCGITEEELYTVFADPIKKLAEEYDQNVESMKLALKRHYDGYHFGDPLKCADIYNPFSIINAFASKEMGDYWFDTGTPSSLIKRMIKRDFCFNEMRGIYATREELLSGITAGDSSIGQLFQTGYLTIKEYDKETKLYILSFPNMEVEKGFDRLTLQAYGSMSRSDFDINRFHMEVVQGKPEEFMRRLRAFTADFPYDQIPDMEVHWQNIMYLLFNILGFYTRTEYKTSDGRIDAVVKTPRFIYVFEFKLDALPETALAQINSKEYPLPFEADGRKLYKIGVEFTSGERRIKDWIICEGN